jgi:hypothetical protein
MTTPTAKPRKGQTTRRQNRGNKGATVTTTPEAIERRERDLQCVELRKAGATWQSIADTLGFADPGHAYKRFQVVMKDYPREDVETARNIISDRYDAMIRALWPKVLKGNEWAIDRVTRISESQAKLLGANRPEKLELSVGGTELDAALRELEVEMKARAGGAPVPVE